MLGCSWTAPTRSGLDDSATPGGEPTSTAPFATPRAIERSVCQRWTRLSAPRTRRPRGSSSSCAPSRHDGEEHLTTDRSTVTGARRRMVVALGTMRLHAARDGITVTT